MTDIHTIAIHYSATYPDQNVTRDDIDLMHRARGFRMIGYNWFIRRDGTLEEGREEGAMTAGIKGHNTGVVHICFAGGLDRAAKKGVGVWNPTAEQLETMIDLIHGVQKRWPRAKRVIGHRDVAATECPGRSDVSEWWAGVSATKTSGGWSAIITAILKLFGAKK